MAEQAHVPCNAKWKINALKKGWPFESYHSKRPLPGIDPQVWSRLMAMQKLGMDRYDRTAFLWFMLLVVFHLLPISGIVGFALIVGFFLCCCWFQRYVALSINKDLKQFVREQQESFRVNGYLLQFVERRGIIQVHGHFEIMPLDCLPHDSKNECVLIIQDLTPRLHVIGPKQDGMSSLFGNDDTLEYQTHVLTTGVVTPHLEPILLKISECQFYLFSFVIVGLIIFVVWATRQGGWLNFACVYVLAWLLLFMGARLVLHWTWYRDELENKVATLPKFGPYRFVFDSESMNGIDSIFLRIVEDEITLV